MTHTHTLTRVINNIHQIQMKLSKYKVLAPHSINIQVVGNGMQSNTTHCSSNSITRMHCWRRLTGSIFGSESSLLPFFLPFLPLPPFAPLAAPPFLSFPLSPIVHIIYSHYALRTVHGVHQWHMQVYDIVYISYYCESMKKYYKKEIGERGYGMGRTYTLLYAWML